MGMPTPSGTLIGIAGREVWLNGAAVALVMSLALFALSRTVADPDLWGHVKFGGDIWRQGAVIQQDVYSYVTGDQTWFNHEWLAELAFYTIFASFHSLGLVAFKTALSALIVGAVYWHLCRRGLDAVRAGAVVLMVTPLLVQSLGALRPQVFTLALFVALLLVVRMAEEGAVRGLWAVPFIFAAWVNFHGGFLLGLAVLVLWAGAHLASMAVRDGTRPAGRSRRAWTIVVVTLLSAVATLANPYGWRLLAFLGRPVTFVRPEITEWQPLPIMSLYGLMYLGFVAVSVAGLVWSRRPRHPALLVVCGCMALLPLTAIRHGSLATLGLAVLAGEHVGDAWRRLVGPARTASTQARWRVRLLGAAIALLLAATLLRESAAHFTCIQLDPGVMGFPVRAVALLRDSGVKGNLAVLFEWGEYVLWQVGPQVKVSVDGRRETVYSDRTYGVARDFWLGQGDWSALLRNPATEMALVSRQYPSFNLMKLVPGWESVYEDRLAGLFVRAGSPLLGQLRGHQLRAVEPDGRGTCFP